MEAIEKNLNEEEYEETEETESEGSGGGWIIAGAMVLGAALGYGVKRFVVDPIKVKIDAAREAKKQANDESTVIPLKKKEETKKTVK